MFDPTDDNVSIYRHGDASVMPGGATGGEDGETPYTEYGQHAGPRIARITDVVLTIGTERQISLDDRPEHWLISSTNTAGAQLLIWLAEGPYGDPIRLDPSRAMALPGTSRFLFLRASGATCTATVLATRGYPFSRL